MLKDYIYEFSEKNRTGTDIPVYSVTNTRGFCKGFFDKEVASSDRSSYKIVPYGFFAYNPSRINVGSIAWQDKEEKAIVSPLYVVFGIDEKKVGQDYLMYYLKSPAVNHRINVLATGTIRKNLKLPVLGEFPFNAPSLDEQKKIVAELDLLSGVIEKQKTELKELGNLAQSTFYDMFGDPIENPKGWEVKKIKEIAIVRPPKSEARNMLNDDEFVSFFPMEELGIKKMNAYSTKEKKLKDALAGSYSFFCDNDVLLAKVTPCFENGKSGIARQLKNGVGFGSSEIIAFRCMSILIPEYLYSCFQCESFLEKGEKCMTGTSGLRRLSKPFVEDTLLAVPPLALQQSFADKIASIEKQKAVLSQSIVETQKLLDYTMDKYFG